MWWAKTILVRTDLKRSTCLYAGMKNRIWEKPMSVFGLKLTKLEEWSHFAFFVILHGIWVPISFGFGTITHVLISLYLVWSNSHFEVSRTFKFKVQQVSTKYRIYRYISGHIQRTFFLVFWPRQIAGIPDWGFSRDFPIREMNRYKEEASTSCTYSELHIHPAHFCFFNCQNLPKVDFTCSNLIFWLKYLIICRIAVGSCKGIQNQTVIWRPTLVR